MDVSDMPWRWAEPDPRRAISAARLLPLLRAGVTAAPDRSALALHLARALFDAEEMEELVQRLRPILSRENASGELLYYLGRGALAIGDLDTAVPALAGATAAEFVRAPGYLAEAFLMSNRPTEALDIALFALKRHPEDSKAFTIAARGLLASGNKDGLWALCAEVDARDVISGYVPSAMAASASTSAQRTEVRELTNYSIWLSQQTLAFPQEFNAQLIGELLDHEFSSPLPSSKATTGAGQRIDRLDLVGGPFAQTLVAEIRVAVDGFMRARARYRNYPLRAGTSGRLAINAWALTVRLDGHEVWHVHPGGLISGVYYVATPALDMLGDADHGAIEFGPYPFTDGIITAWPRRKLRPHTGLLLLFPSYFGHRTLATNLSEPRICVAFDIFPLAAGTSGQI